MNFRVYVQVPASIGFSPCMPANYNSTARAPSDAIKIAVKKVSDVNVSMFGPEF